LIAHQSSEVKFAQLCIYHPEFTANVRSSNNTEKDDDKDKLDDTIILNLSSMVHESNPFIILYKTSQEVINTEHNEVNSF
jgi:hypothetical protein